MRFGTRVGVDVGKVRIGVARCDPSGMLATPIETVARTRDGSDVSRVLALVAEHEAIEIVVGLPLALSGAHTSSTDDAVGFAERLADAGETPVRLVDERLSTVTAQAGLRASGRTARNSRSVVDQAAATVILQHALDAERASGRPPGTLAETRIGPES
jgi:putative Holliday junction resolvase